MVIRTKLKRTKGREKYIRGRGKQEYRRKFLIMRKTGGDYEEEAKEGKYQ